MAHDEEHDATLSEIARAIYATLQGLTIENNGPLANIERIATDQVDRDPTPELAGMPAVLLPPHTERYEQESLEREGMGLGNTLVEKHRYFIGASTWRLYLIADTIAGTEPDGYEGMVLEEIEDIILKKLAGLFIPGLYLNERLVPVDSEIVRMDPGRYVKRMRFTARRVIAAFDVDDGSVPFSRVEGNVREDGLDYLVDPFEAP